MAVSALGVSLGFGLNNTFILGVIIVFYCMLYKINDNN
jgi:hypothetical protein